MRCDKRVIEVRSGQPAEVDGVVKDDLLQLVVAEVTTSERGIELHLEFARGADGSRAADADDPPLLAGQARTGPDLAVEVREVAERPERRRCGRRLGEHD